MSADTAAAIAVAPPAGRGLLAFLRERPEWVCVPGLFVLVTGAWELGFWLAEVPLYIAPAPSAIFRSLVSGMKSGIFIENALYTLSEAMLGFLCAAVAGIAIALKQRNPKIRIALADPMGAALYSYYTSGVLKAEGSSITEGIGQGRITKNLEGAPIDTAYQIPDEEAVPIIFDLLLKEGLCMGGSTGINVAGAIRLAKEMGPGHTIVTILADYGTRYQTKLFNPEFLRSKGLPVPEWLERKVNIAVPYEKA